jgi:hypothetical protein
MFILLATVLNTRYRLLTIVSEVSAILPIETNVPIGPPGFSLFSGREGRNNERIMQLLSRDILNAYQIAKQLGKKYNTIFDRLKDLETKSVIKVVGKTEAKKSRNQVSLYGLASYGVYAAIFQTRNKRLQRHCLNICGRMFVRLWDDFSKLYELNPKRSGVLRKWIGSDEGVFFLLSQFGYSFLDRNYHILLVFRRMIDLSIFLSEWQFMSTLIVVTFPSEKDVIVERAEDISDIKTPQEALMALGTLAYNHPRLRRLYDAMKEADDPLLQEIQRIAKAEHAQNTVGTEKP